MRVNSGGQLSYSLQEAHKGFRTRQTLLAKALINLHPTYAHFHRLQFKKINTFKDPGEPSEAHWCFGSLFLHYIISFFPHTLAISQHLCIVDSIRQKFSTVQSTNKKIVWLQSGEVPVPDIQPLLHALCQHDELCIAPHSELIAIWHAHTASRTQGSSSIAPGCSCDMRTGCIQDPCHNSGAAVITVNTEMLRI